LHDVKQTKMTSARVRWNSIAKARSKTIGKRGSHHR